VPLTTLDIVLLLPDDRRELACDASSLLADRMGAGAGFRLGQPYPGPGGGICEPHVSLFMLSVDTSEVRDAVAAAAEVARSVGPVYAEAVEYRPNPVHAPEVHFAPSPPWTNLQDRVLEKVAPLRNGRLRDLDPAGYSIKDTMDRLEAAGPNDLQLNQLRTYGYDEIGDRFSPHVTLAWPVSRDWPVNLDGLPAPSAFNGELSELAVYSMSPYGTCTERHDSFRLTTQARIQNEAGVDPRRMGTGRAPGVQRDGGR
jgi:hypothetical protein